MKPQSTKATGRVKSPTRMRSPPMRCRREIEELLRAVLDEEQGGHDPERCERLGLVGEQPVEHR
jgi:hypothetical protein